MNVLLPTWRFDFIEGKSLRCTKFRIVSSPHNLARIEVLIRTKVFDFDRVSTSGTQATV